MPRYYTSEAHTMIKEYNAAQAKAQEGLKETNNYKPEFLKERFNKDKNANISSFADKALSLAKRTKEAYKLLRPQQVKALYPLYNSDQKVAGELQRAEAKEIIRRGNKDEILSALREGGELGRADFVSTLLESVQLPEVDSVFGAPDEKSFYSEVRKIRSEHFEALKVPKIDEKISDIKNTLSVAARFFVSIREHLIKGGELNYIQVPDLDTHDFGDQMSIAGQRRLLTALNEEQQKIFNLE